MGSIKNCVAIILYWIIVSLIKSLQRLRFYCIILVFHFFFVPNKTLRPSCTCRIVFYCVFATNYITDNIVHWLNEEVGNRDNSSWPEDHLLINKDPPDENRVSNHDRISEPSKNNIIIILSLLMYLYYLLAM